MHHDDNVPLSNSSQAYFQCAIIFAVAMASLGVNSCMHLTTYKSTSEPVNNGG